MKTKQVLTSVAAFVLALAVGVTSISFNSVDVQAAMASSMKVESFNGKVTLKNAKGKARTIKSGTKLLNGDNLATKTESTANILLDDTKAALVEESSQVSVKQSGKDLDLIIDKGSVFFDVSKKLTSKESFEIKTSNMVCGIRGTIGEVKVKVNKKKKTVKSYIYLLEGKVKVTYNKTKKKKATKTITAGQKLTLTTDTKTGKSTPKVAKIEKTDIKKTVGAKLQADETLMTRVQTACPSIDWPVTIEDAIAGKHENIEEDDDDTTTTTSVAGPKITGSVSKKNIEVTYNCIYFGNYWQEDTNGDGKADKNDDKTPIKWRILSKNGDEALLVADKILDRRIHDSALSTGFLNDAFSKTEQKASLKLSYLSLDAISNKEYGFSNYDKKNLNGESVGTNGKWAYNGEDIEICDFAKLRVPTAFARGEGFSKSKAATTTGYACSTIAGGCSDWWLANTRSNVNGQWTAYGVLGTGKVAVAGFVSDGDGVCPALTIAHLSKAKYKYAGTVTCGPKVDGGVKYSE